MFLIREWPLPSIFYLRYISDDAKAIIIQLPDRVILAHPDIFYLDGELVQSAEKIKKDETD